MSGCKMSYFPKLVPSSSELSTGPEPPSCPTTLTTAGFSPSRIQTITSFGWRLTRVAIMPRMPPNSG